MSKFFSVQIPLEHRVGRVESSVQIHSRTWKGDFWIFPSTDRHVQSLCLIGITLQKPVLFSSYVIEKGVCYLALCEAGFPKKLAFAYLEDLEGEFSEQYGTKVPSVSRPYSFIEFGEKHLIYVKAQLNTLSLYTLPFKSVGSVRFVFSK